MYICYYFHFPKNPLLSQGSIEWLPGSEMLDTLGALKSRLVSMIYTKALKWSGGLIFDLINLKIDMHSNDDMGNNFYYRHLLI